MGGVADITESATIFVFTSIGPLYFHPAIFCKHRLLCKLCQPILCDLASVVDLAMCTLGLSCLQGLLACCDTMHDNCEVRH